MISRAGAGSISEFCLLHKPVILVPSPNVAEDHQTKNALALVDKDAAIYVKDVEAKEKLLPVALETIANREAARLEQEYRQASVAGLGDNYCEGGIEEPLPLSLPRREGGIDSTAIVLFIISYFWKKSLKKKFEYE